MNMKSVRFLFSMNSKMHQEVKIRAAMRNITMAKWICQAIATRIADERKYEEKLQNKE